MRTLHGEQQRNKHRVGVLTSSQEKVPAGQLRGAGRGAGEWGDSLQPARPRIYLLDTGTGGGTSEHLLGKKITHISTAWLFPKTPGLTSLARENYLVKSPFFVR
jgi:hypothetical protein